MRGYLKLYHPRSAPTRSSAGLPAPLVYGNVVKDRCSPPVKIRSRTRCQDVKSNAEIKCSQSPAVLGKLPLFLRGRVKLYMLKICPDIVGGETDLLSYEIVDEETNVNMDF